jgi:subtilisin-like proprotein convertase family protein
VNIPLTVGDVQVGGNIGVMATPVPAGIVTVAPAMDASGNWSLNITPQPFQYYSNIAVTITATNLQGATSSAGFDVTVFQVPLSPVLVETAIPNITMGRATYGSTTFHVWDPQGLTLNPSALSTDAKDLGIVSTTLGTPVSQTLFGHTVSVYPVTVTVLPNGAFFGGPIPVDVTVSDTSTAKPLNTAFNVTVIEGTPLFVNQDSSPANPILLPIGYPLASNAFPFPSAISVDNLVGYVTGVEVTLVGFQHQFPSEVDVLLVGPDNKTAVVLMAHAGDGLPTPAGGLRLTFDQASPNTLVPGAALATGTYQPANLAGALSFAGPAPAPTLSGFYSTNLSAFNGMSPLGKWYLYVMDDNIGTTGSIDNWILSLQTSPAILPIGTVTTVENNPVLVPVTLASDSLTNLSGLTVSAASKSDEVPTNLVGLLVQNIVSTPNSTNPSLWYLTITPGLNLPSIATNVPPLTKASVDISVTVNGASPFTTSFPLTVLYSNIPPFVTASTNNLVINEDGSGTVTFTFNDVNATILSNGVAVYSRNTALLPNSANNIAIATIPTNGYAPGTTPNSVTVTLTPAPYVFGTNLVDFVVSGGTASTTNTIGLSVIHVYQPPIIGGLSASNYTAAATTTQPITFWAASVEGVPPADITVTATSLTPTLVPNTANNIVLSTTDKTGTNYSLVITPVAAQSGNAFINVVATETTGNKTSRTSTFELVVGAPAANFAGTSPVQLLTNIPSISPYPVQFTMPAPGDSPLVGNVYDVKLELRGFSHTNPGNLDFLLVSPDGTPVMLMSGAGGASPVSNLDLVFDQSGVAMPLAGTLISGTYQASYYTKGAHALPGPAPQPTPTDYNGSLLAFQDKASANGTWSLYINDKTGQDTGAIAGGAFLTVSTRPVISISGPTVVTMGENPGPLSTTSVGYTVSDSTIVPTNLVVTAATAKGNNVLQAGTQDIQISQPAANGTGTITLTPEYLTFGSNLPITLTVTRTNDNVTASANLTVTVVSTNFPPIVYRLLAQSTPATTPIDVQILASDIDTPLSSLSITATPLGAADAQIIPKSGLLFTNSGSNSVTGLTPVSASQPGLGSVWLHITPNQASSGSATIQLTVTDPKTASGYVFTNIVTSNLVVNVTSVPGIPTVTPNFTLPQSVAAGTSKTLMFTVGTPTPAPPPVLVLTNVTSTVPTLVNNNNIVVASAGGNVWNVTLPAQASAKGPTTISVQAYDATHNLFSAPYTFTLTVTPTPQHNYANDTAIDIIDVSPASPYPSTIPVGGLNGMINNVTVTLLGFWHQYPSDVGALLISPAGKKIVLMNRAGAGFAIPTTGINLTFDQNAATPVPQFAPILAGSYQPADYLIASGAYNFYPNAPQHPYGLSLADLVGTAPNGTWSLYMQDSVAVESGYINNGWSLSITTQPVINGLADVTIPESGSTTENFSIADDSPSGPSFTFAMSSPDATLFPQSGLSVAPLPGDKTGTNFVLTIAPGLDHFGTNTVTVQATDIDNLVATRTINVSVPFSPQPPLVSLVPTNYLNMLAGATLQVPVIYSDPQNLPMTLSVVDSSNTNLLPLTSITIVGTNLQIRPFGANSGQAVLTVQVQEQGGTGLSTTTNLTLNVTPVPNLFGAGGYIDMVDFSPANPYPSSIKVSGIVGNILGAKVTLRNFGHTFPHDVSAVLVAPGGQEIILLSRVGNGAMSGAVDLTLDSAATTPLPPSQPLTGGTYAPTSYNPSLVFLQGFPAGPYVTNLTVLSNTAPTGQWSLYVQDDTRQDSGAITNGWTIQFVTSAPTIQPVAGQTVPENGSLGVALQVASNVGNDVTKIVVTPNAPTLENPLGLISEGTLVASKPDTNGLVTLTVTPAQNLPSAAPGWLVNSNGTAQINVTVVDGTNPPTSMSFPLTVTYVNQGPTIVGLENTNTPANAPLTFSFAAADVDTPVASLEVGIQSISDNTDSSISLSGKGATEYITLTPNDFSGAAIITVTNFDPISGLTATQSVTVTVTTPAPPVLAPIDPITALPGAPVQVTLKITPGGTPLSGLAVSYSGLPANDASIAPLTQTTAVITPAAGFIGTFNVTATVSDGVTKVSQTFPVTWAPPVPPTLGAIAAQSVEAGQSKTFALPIQPGGVALSALTVSAASANTGIATASGAANASVILTGVQPGSTSVTVTVNDGYNSPVTQTFQVAVFAPQPPVWGLLTNQIVTGLDTPVTITLPVTSVETPISNLVFAAIIKTNVVSSVVFTNYATNVTATFNVVFNAVGSEAVTLTMFDGYNTESVETEVIVTELPAVQAIGPQTVQENGSLPVSFKVASYVGNDVTQILVMPSVTQENPPGLVSSGKLVASSPDTNGVVTLTIVPGANLPSAYPGSAPFWPLGSNGTAQITLQVNDGGFISTNSFPLTVIYANQAPSIVGLVNTNTTVNTPITIGFMAADVDTPGSMLQVGIQGAVDNTGSGIFLTSKGNTQLLTLIPFGSAGAASITITNFDPLSQLTATQTVTITVTLEAPPTLAAIPDVSTPENTPVTVPLNVTSPVIPISQLSFNYKLSNSNLVASVAFSVNGSTVTAQITPAKNQMGSSAVTIYVSDGVVTVSQPFDFAVTAPVGPTLGPLANVTTRENSPINLQLVVTDPVTPLANLTFGGSSSNPGLVQSVVVNNNGTTATATVNLVANAFGAAVVTISVSDGFTTASQSFSLVVQAAPSVSPIGPQTVAENGTLPPIPFSILNADLATLSVSASAYANGLVTGLTIGGTGSNLTITVTVAPNTSGTSVINIVADDQYGAGSGSFLLTVTPVPTLGPIADQTTPKNTPVNVLLAVTDPVTPLSNLTFTASASNTKLVQSVVVNKNGTTASATINLVTNAYGVSLVTISVNDGFMTVSQSFALLVLPTPPSLGPISDVTAIAGATAVNVPLNVVSPDTALSQLTFVGSSTNTDIVSGVTFSTVGSTVTATVNLVSNKVGKATVKIDVSDGYATSSQSFAVTVGTPARPILSATLVGTVLHITFTGVPNGSYVIQSSPDLKTWTPVGPAITADSNGKVEYDAPVNSSGPQYFRALFQ